MQTHLETGDLLFAIAIIVSIGVDGDMATGVVLGIIVTTVGGGYGD